MVKENKMKALVVGYGSIGRRHAMNLLRSDFVDEVIIYTKIKNDLNEHSKKKISFIDSATTKLNEVCKQCHIDIAIIANETYKHIDSAILLAKEGLDLFIEKPISHNLEKIDVLCEIVISNKVKIFIGYNMRFLPVLRYIKKYISRGVIGNLYFAKIEVGQYLPLWRTNIGYSDSYSSRSERGGGVALDLSHEVDYMRYIFGEPLIWKTLKSKASDLEINTEDVFEGLYQYKNGFLCNIHMDYLQNDARRQIRIIGSQGRIVCDLIEKWIEVHSAQKEIKLTDEKLFRIEDTYIDELNYFLTMCISNEESYISMYDGIKTLQLLDDGHDRKE